MNSSASSHKPTPGTRYRWMILLLLLGVATVILISRTDQQEMEIAVAVTFENIADNLLIMDDSRHSVTLLVVGTATALRTIDAKTAVVRLDLSGLEAGTHTISIDASQVTLPDKISLKAVLTPWLTARLEMLTVKTVDAVAVLEGHPAPGFAVVGVDLRPDRIVLKGPATILADIETVKTYPIDLESASEPFKKEVPLNLPEAVDVEPPLRIVLAEVAVRERIVTRVLEGIPVTASGSSAPHQIRPETINLSVVGPETIVAAIESDPAFAVSIDLTGLTAGDHHLKATINLPIQTTLVQVSPEHFVVTIEK